MGRADGPVPPPPSYPPTLAAQPASVLPSPFFSRILAACSSSRPHLSTTPPSPCVSSNSCRSASLAHGSSFPFPFLSFPVAGATSPSGSGGIPFAIYPSLLPTPAGRTSFSPFIQHFHEVGMTGAAAIRGTTEEKIVVFEDTSGVDNKYTIVQFTGEALLSPSPPLYSSTFDPLLSAASPLSPPTCADVTAASLLFDPPSYADVAASSSRCSASGARGRASHATRVVQLRVAEDQSSGTSLNNEARPPRRSAGELHLSPVAAILDAVRWPPLRWRPKLRSAGTRRPSLAKDNPRRSTFSTTPTPSHRALPRHCRLLHSGDRRSS
uniref:Uncharacterized protein n=1 Tax=Oryza rufipogon TaxID=4529 RepID=A0A0E0PP81_ORYRU